MAWQNGFRGGGGWAGAHFPDPPSKYLKLTQAREGGGGHPTEMTQNDSK